VSQGKTINSLTSFIYPVPLKCPDLGCCSAS